MAFAACIAACSDSNEPVPEPQPEPEPEDTTIDLSADGMANCYIVQAPGLYKFPADNRFNLGEGLPVPPEIHPDSAALVWQTVKGSIVAVALDKSGDVPSIRFEVADATGNALIAALDDSGDIVWSWHIWMPEDRVASVSSSTGYEVMNMNLGAVRNSPGDALSYGMLYQWGRKDPFPAAATLTGNTQTVSAPMYDINGNEVLVSHSSWTANSDNNIKFSIANPTVCLSNYPTGSRDWLVNGNDALWGNPNGFDAEGGANKFPDKGRKTCYDPSPAGWRVAPPDAFLDFTSTGGYVWDCNDFNVLDVNGDSTVDINDYNYGWHFMVNGDTALYFPAAARFDGSYAMLMGSMSGLWGNYWSNAPHSSAPGSAFCCLSFQVKGQNGEDWITASPAAAASRADAFSVRCVRE